MLLWRDINIFEVTYSYCNSDCFIQVWNPFLILTSSPHLSSSLPTPSYTEFYESSVSVIFTQELPWNFLLRPGASCTWANPPALPYSSWESYNKHWSRDYVTTGNWVLAVDLVRVGQLNRKTVVVFTSKVLQGAYVCPHMNHLVWNSACSDPVIIWFLSLSRECQEPG